MRRAGRRPYSTLNTFLGTDFRHHSVEVTHIAKAFQIPIAGDDAAQAFLVNLEDIPWEELAFDHAQILKDYINWKTGNEHSPMLHP